MRFLRSFVFGGAVAAASLLSTSAMAQQVSAAASSDDPLRFTFDVHVGGTYRVGEVAGSDSRGGGLVGLGVFVGPLTWLAIGAEYERSFIGREKVDEGNGIFSRTSRDLDALWLLGRVYPYQSENFALYLQLGLGPAWQHVSVEGSTQGAQPARALVEPFSCSGDDSATLGFRGAFGAELPLTNLLILTSEVGLDQHSLSKDPVEGCGAAAGSTTLLAGRIGFAIATGRPKPEAAPPPPPPPPPDTDLDGIIDAQDACPTVVGVPSADPMKHGCPLPTDRDADGIFDEQDACPDVAGVPNADPAKNGCPPPDTDGDGIIDEKDACPELKGVASDDPAQNGCPPDTDGDGIRDDKDACPNEKGPASEDPTKNGCPLVQVTENEIVINQQVQFETNKSKIRPESDDLLNQIAQVMKDHPEITKVEVQGHTDSTGSKYNNKTLSQARADSVRKALIARGVEAKVLVAKGYGQEVPIGDNETEEGKAKNRRVQFKIVEKKDVEKKEAPAAPAGEKKESP